MTDLGLEPGILLPALVAGMLVLATHVPLGMEVLRRGIVFLDLAIAQIAGLGVILINALGTEPSGWAVQLGAVTAALAGALLLRFMEKRRPQQQEAVIGVTFVVAASTAILLMSQDPHGAEHLKDLLVGQILWTTWVDLIPLGFITLGVLIGWFRFRLGELPLGFYLLFALTITASVQVVGVYLVFASLIVPALAAEERLAIGYAGGGAGYVLGLLASAMFDVPAGAAIVLTLVMTTMALSWWRRGTTTPA